MGTTLFLFQFIWHQCHACLPFFWFVHMQGICTCTSVIHICVSIIYLCILERCRLMLHAHSLVVRIARLVYPAMTYSTNSFLHATRRIHICDMRYASFVHATRLIHTVCQLAESLFDIFSLACWSACLWSEQASKCFSMTSVSRSKTSRCACMHADTVNHRVYAFACSCICVCVRVCLCKRAPFSFSFSLPLSLCPSLCVGVCLYVCVFLVVACVLHTWMYHRVFLYGATYCEYTYAFTICKYVCRSIVTYTSSLWAQCQSRARRQSRCTSSVATGGRSSWLSVMASSSRCLYIFSCHLYIYVNTFECKSHLGYM